MHNRNARGVAFAVLAATFYALNSPLSKLLLRSVSTTMMAAFLYLGAGLGMLLLRGVQRASGHAPHERRLTRSDLPYTAGMVALDIAAPIALMAGISRTSAANASLLNNFEIVATALLAWAIFGEAISRKLWLGIALVTLSSLLLCAQDVQSLSFSAGSLFVLLACTCWGLENNCTRKLSDKDPLEIVVIKGVCCGLGSLGIALTLGEPLPALVPMLLALGLGFVAYGLSIALYIYAQRELGAAKTSAYYAVAPFIGTALSLLIFREMPTPGFLLALLVVLAGTYVVTPTENPV